MNSNNKKSENVQMYFIKLREFITNHQQKILNEKPKEKLLNKI
jgi:hypothetical protein